MGQQPQWADRPQPNEPDSLPQELPDLLRRIYRARGILTADALDYSLSGLPDPNSLGGISAGAARLAAAIQNNERILVVGDFDADGATSCALAIKALQRFGATHTQYLVPNRFEFGYGLTPELLEVATDPAPDVILTVDNGIAAHAGVDAARAAGIDVIVTDHHLPANTLPNALAIINPQLEANQAFAGRSLAGVGVTFYLMLGVRATLRNLGAFADGIKEPPLADLLDLVALGTVADLVSLDSVNRTLVDQGLRRIRSGQCCAGITALLEVAGRDPRVATTDELAFAAAPRLNAAGRIADIDIGIECLIAQNPQDAQKLAEQLHALNQERRSIEQSMRDAALSGLDAESIEGVEALPPILCVMREDWHQGVVGIVAGRLKERFHRPVIAFAPGDNGELKGSGRSTANIHMRDLIEAVDIASDRALIKRFGGHAMAAGLTLPAAAYEPFKACVEQIVRDQYGDKAIADVILTDGQLAADEFSLQRASEIRYAGPWGSGCPAPCFRGEFFVRSTRVVGQTHVRLELSPKAALEQRLEAIAFNAIEHWPELQRSQTEGSEISLIFRLDVNRYQGRDRLQLVVDHFLLEAPLGLQ